MEKYISKYNPTIINTKQWWMRCDHVRPLSLELEIPEKNLSINCKNKAK